MGNNLSSAKSLINDTLKNFDSSFEKKAMGASAVVSSGDTQEYTPGMRRRIGQEAKKNLRQEIDSLTNSIRNSDASAEAKKKRITRLRERGKSIGAQIDDSIKGTLKFQAGGLVRGMGAATKGGKFRLR